MEDIIKVIIKPEHFRDASAGYAHNWKDGKETPCVLEVALAEMFPEKALWVGRYKASIHAQRYNIPLEAWGDESGPYSPRIINKLSEKAKGSLDGIPTVEITLTKIPADSDN